jgi:nicotinic acid mononucleotide adenylyltransferase
MGYLHLNEFYSLCNRLNESPWMGAICEVGIGLPFQSMYANNPGASRTILFSHSPYSKAFQPNDVRRSVSHEMASRYAWDNYRLCFENDRIQNDHIFSVATSAAHKITGERGQSHGWTSVVACEKGGSEPKAYSFHWRVDKSYRREDAGRIMAKYVAWFLDKILLNRWDTWGEAIENMPNEWKGGANFLFNIDVIRAPDITMEEHLTLADDSTPLLYHLGEFKRPADYIRRYSWCYRGSFNPITISHESIGSAAMFEISLDNARKGRVTLGELTHRIKMIDLAERPTLITSSRPLFVRLHRLLMDLDAGSMEYLIGADTFNAVTDEKYIDVGKTTFFSDFEKDNPAQSARFLVLSREDCEITENDYSDKIGWRIIEAEYPEVSSTAVREGNFEYVNDRVAKYIKDNNLYSSTIKKL